MHLKIQLTLSLHATNQTTRDKVIPHMVTYDVVSAFPNKSFNLRRLSTTMVYNPAKDALWPIPYTEMRTNTAITENNPGY